MKPKSPCKGCEGHKQIEGCHSTCDAYLAYVEENKAFKEMVRKKKQSEYGRGEWLTDRQFVNRRDQMSVMVLRQHKK